MSAPMLKYRTRFTSSMDNRLWERFQIFQIFAEQSRIPKSRLIDEAIEDLLKKYKVPAPKKKTKTKAD